MEPFETFEHAGFTVELHSDWEDPSSPADWDTLGAIVIGPRMARDYALPGSRETTGTEDEAIERGGFPLLARYLRMTEGAVVLPFTFQDYGSGGARLWEDKNPTADDDVDGFIIATPERANELGVPLEDVSRQLSGELCDWAAYVEGLVIGFVVRDPENGEVVESCWGFYPEPPERGTRAHRAGRSDEYDYVRDEAREAAECERHDRDINIEPDIETGVHSATRVS